MFVVQGQSLGKADDMYRAPISNAKHDKKNEAERRAGLQCTLCQHAQIIRACHAISPQAVAIGCQWLALKSALLSRA